MSRPRNRIADLAQYVVFRAVVCVVQALPPSLAYWVADRLAWLAHRLDRRHRRVAVENVRAAFPHLDADPPAAERLVRTMYRHFVRAAVETLLMPRKFHVANWRAFVDLYPARGMPAALFSPRPALIVTGHFGNWEMAGYATGAMGFRTFAVARPLNNPYIDRFVSRLRQATGQTIIAKKDEFDRLTTALAAGGKVATLADQDAGERGVFVDFFGRPASTHKAIALMAVRFDALVVVTGVPRVDRAGRPAAPALAGMDQAYYAVEVGDVIDPRDYADRPDAVPAITARYTAALEQLVRRHPEQYLWIHRRWKSRPRARAAGAAA